MFYFVFFSLIRPLSYALKYFRSTIKGKKSVFPLYCARLFVPLSYALKYFRSTIKGKKSVFPLYCARLFVPLSPENCACGGIGRHARLRIWCLRACKFESYQAYFWENFFIVGIDSHLHAGVKFLRPDGSKRQSRARVLSGVLPYL